MKKKNHDNGAGNVPQKSNPKNNKAGAVNINTTSGVTDKVKSKPRRGLTNEGTNVSYDEER